MLSFFGHPVFSGVPHPISLYKCSIDTNFVVPVAIRAASVLSFRGRASHTAYSKCSVV